MEEILLKFKADQESLNGSFKELETKAAKIESELSNTFKTIAKESGGALDPFAKDLDELVKDIPRLKEFAKVMQENANSLDKNSEEFKTLNKLTKEFTSNISQLEKTKGTLNGMADNMAKTGESTKSLRTQMRLAQQDVAELSAKFGATSKEAIEAAKRAAQLRDTIGDAKSLTEAFNPDAKFRSLSASVSGVIGGFQAYEGALALIGVESEDLQKTLVRLNALMALSQGLQALGEAKDSFSQLKAVAIDAFKGIRAAIGSTGIGLLVVALGTVVAYWDDIKEAVTGVSGKIKENADLAKKDIEIQDKKLSSLNDQDEILKAQGLSERRILEIKKQQLLTIYERQKADLQAIIAVERAELESTKRRRESLFKYLGIYGQIFEGIDLFNVDRANENLKKTEESQKETLLKLENQIAGYNNRIKELDKKEVEKRNEINKKANEKKAKDNEDLEKQYESERQKREEEYTKKRSDAINKIIKEGQEENKKALIETLTIDDNDIPSTNIPDYLLAGIKEDKRKQQFEEDKAMIMELATFAQNGLLLQLGIDPQSVERIKQNLDTVLTTFNNNASTTEQRITAMANLTANTIGTIVNALFSAEKQRIQEETDALAAQQEEEIRLAGDNEQKKDIIRQKYDLKRKELKRKEAEADKKKAIFDATIQTAAAVATTFAKFGFPLGIVPAAIMAGLGAAQIALIAAQPIPKFAKGGRPKDGLQKGRPHSAGGILGEFEGDEFIVNKHQTRKNLGLIEAVNLSDEERDKYINGHYIMPALKAQESEYKKQEQARMIEIESLIASKVANNTLKGIHRELRENTQAVRSLKGSDNIKW